MLKTIYARFLILLSISIAFSSIPSGFPLAGSVMAEDGCQDLYHVKAPPTAYHAKFLMDRLEYVTSGKEDKLIAWEATGYISGESQRLWIEAEGEHDTGSSEGGEIERLDILHSRMISPFFHARAGLGYMGTYGPGAEERFQASIGLKGVVPYGLELDTNARVTHKGEWLLDLEFEHDLLVTQKLVLQPRVDATWSFNRIGDLGIGPGLANLAIGLRLRYEINRKFAPYLGVSWHTMTGGTRDIAREEGEPRDRTRLFCGLRFWF